MYDFHTHFIPSEVMDWIKQNKTAINAEWVQKDPKKEDFLVVNNKWGFELKKQFIDAELYLQEQAEAGVTHSVISPIPQLFMYDFDAQITAEVSQVYNDALLNWSAKENKRISALGTVPLNNPQKAADELERAMKKGIKGAIIGPGIPNHMLTDEFFAPFFHKADELGAILFIHPLLNEDPRLKKRMMPNLIGVPWETTVCATDILLSGMLDQYPNIKFLLAHGGGFLPYQIGRLTKGYEMWPAVNSQLQAPPLEYVKKFWFDTVLWNEKSLNFLLDTVGEERVVPGTDYPFDLCMWPPAKISEKGVNAILQK